MALSSCASNTITERVNGTPMLVATGCDKNDGGQRRVTEHVT
ncbi:MAG: hypothetical protein ACI8PT_002573 [Gammaproteobacteria bacterium]|jgi:hypothetical protein